MDYLAHFNLSEEPFRLTPDPFYFYPSRTHNDVLASLDYAVEQKEGFSLIVGEPGTGKTTLLRVFVNTWRDKAEIALIMTPRLSPSEFLAAVLDDLKIKPRSKNKNDMIKAFRDILVKHSSNDKPVIVIVDEVQDMPEETLEELRLLSNLETDTEKLLQIILVGQPDIKLRLQSEGLRQLDQRISVRATLKPLTASETADYINLRLVRAGKGNIFLDDHAKAALYRISGGIPRLVNLLASRSIMAAYLQGSDVVGRINVLQAKRYIWGEPSFFGNFRKRAFRTVMGTAAAIALCAGIALVSRDAIGHASPSPTTAAKKAPIIVASAQPTTGRAALTPTQASSPATLATVLPPGANLRTTPSIDGSIVGEVREGSKLPVLTEAADEKDRRWFNVGSKEKPQWLSQYVVKIERPDH